MPRPITPVAVRRLRTDGMLEVQSKGGQWFDFRLLSAASKDAVRRALSLKGYDKSNPLPSRELFLLLDGKSPTETRQPNPHTDSDNRTESEHDADGESDADSQPDNDSDGDQPDQSEQPDDGGDDDTDSDNQPDNGDNQQENEMNMEDIVRKIAGEMDSERSAEVGRMYVTQAQHANDLSALRAEFDVIRSEFTPETLPDSPDDKRLYVVTTRVELTTPLVHGEIDGLFHEQFPTLLKMLSLGCHAYLPGPAGTGKSHAAESAATALGWRFASLSCGPTMPESRIWGGMDANGKFHEPAFVALARHAMNNPDSGAIFCLDEMDNGHAGLLASLNSALANGWFTAPNGDTITMGGNFALVGCANTFGTGPTAEFSGRNKLDAATLDRFTYIPWDTDEGMEEAIVRTLLDDVTASAWLDVWRTLRANIAAHGLKFFASMRGCLRGAKMIAAGMDIDEVVMLNLGNKIPADQWAKVNPL